MQHARLAQAFALLASFILAACGGGGGGNNNPPAGSTTTSVGTISGFGSVIVNGVRYDDTTASVTLNDTPSTRDQLRVGMVVAVEGNINNCSNLDDSVCTGQATRIRFRNNLEGPITTINRLTNTIRVMEQEIQLDDSTILSGTGVTDLTSLQVNDVVSVSGLEERDQDRTRALDRIHARLLDKTGTFTNNTTPIQIKGTVEALDAAASIFKIGQLRVSFAGVSASNLPAGSLANGQFVEVIGKNLGTGLLTCDRIQLRDRISFPDASKVEVEGVITEFISQSNFKVAGQSVNASSAVFRNGTAADLVNGVKVEAEGTMSSGVLLAAKIAFKLATQIRIEAPLQAKDNGNTTLTMLGRTIQVAPTTQFVDRTSGPGKGLRALSFADLQVNDRLEVRAAKNSAGELIAARVERTEDRERLVVKGPVDAKIANTQLTIVGIGVGTGSNTRYRDIDGNLITDLAFYNLVQVPPAVPSIVRTQGVAGTANAIDATRTVSTLGEVEIAQ